MEVESAIFDFFNDFLIFSRRIGQFVGKKLKSRRKSQKSQILLPTFFGVFCSGHFKPSLSKIGQEMAKFYNFEKKILEKNIFRGHRDSPEPKNGGQILKNDF